jgi:hypothetical protein
VSYCRDHHHEGLKLMSSHGIATETMREHSTAKGEAFGWLRLIGTPGFALMALLTGFTDSGRADLLCTGLTSPFGGMLPMYLLMSVIHATPWMQMVARVADCKRGACSDAC